MTNDIYQVLHDDHEEVAELFDEVDSTSDEQGARRLDLYQAIRRALVRHAAAEEEVFYPRLEQDDESHSPAIDAISEHEEMRRLLDDIDGLPEPDAEWVGLMGELRDLFEKHVEEEEGDLFARARELFDDDEAREMARAFQESKDSHHVL